MAKNKSCGVGLWFQMILKDFLYKKKSCGIQSKFLNNINKSYNMQLRFFK